MLKARLTRSINGDFKKKNGYSPQSSKKSHNFPWKKNLAVQFHLRFANVDDGTAAKVWFYDYLKDESDQHTELKIKIKNSKRSIVRDFPTNLASVPTQNNRKTRGTNCTFTIADLL